MGKENGDTYILYKIDSSTPLLKTESMMEINRFINDRKDEAFDKGIQPDDYEIVVQKAM